MPAPPVPDGVKASALSLCRIDLICGATIAIDVFYSKMHHMYLFIMNIEEAIPKNIYAPCVTHRATQRPPWQSQQTQFLLFPFVVTAFLHLPCFEHAVLVLVVFGPGLQRVVYAILLDVGHRFCR